MLSIKRMSWFVMSLALALTLAVIGIRLAAAEPEHHLQAESPLREVVVAIAFEPSSLYPYADGARMSAPSEVMAALMDGPFTTLSYDHQATILTKVPSWDDGDQVLQTVTVEAGTRVVAADGSPVDLVSGTLVRPAGCRDSGCQVTFDGTPLEMDQLVVTFELRSNVRWSDGAPLTAEDAVFGRQIACDPDTPTDKYECARTAGYTVDDALTTVWVGLPGHLSSQSQTNFWTPLPYHVLGTMTAAEILAGDYGRQPLGWGPFRLLEWVPGSHITLERNPHYWRPGYPKLDRVTFRFLPDQDQVYMAMLRGEIQVASHFTGMPGIRVAELLDPEVTPTMRLEWSPGITWEQMSFGILPADSRLPVFADAQVRRALAHAIDRQRIIDEVLHGLGSPPSAYTFEEHPLYPTTLTTYSYDPSQAAALLDAAGWVDTTGSGIRNKDGHEFVITYQTTTADERIQTGHIIRENLAAVGIQLDLEFLPPAVFFADGPHGPVFGRQFDLATFAWLSPATPPCTLFTTDGIPREANGWIGQNNTGYSNPAYDAACHPAMNALPGTTAYVQGHQAALEIFAQDVPALPLFRRPIAIAVSSGMSVGPTADPTENRVTWNIWEWDLAMSTTAEPNAPATLVAPNQIVTATFGAGAFAEAAVVTYATLPSQTTPPDLVGVGRFFELGAASTATGEPVSPQTSYELTVTYAQASVPRHLDESTLALYVWNGVAWMREPTSQVDVEANVVKATPDHFSVWALLGERSHSVYLPLIQGGVGSHMGEHRPVQAEQTQIPQ